jgi:hypothetical protein
MKLKGPLVTLFGGFAVAVVLFVANVHVNKGRAEAAPESSAPAATASSAIGPAPGSSTKDSPRDTPRPPILAGKNSYAGATDGGAAGIAIATNAGKAVAYVCDGKSAEAWLNGSAEDGRIVLSGPKGSLTGTYTDGLVTGTVTAGSKQWHFSIKLASSPSGLYRSAAGVRSRLDASWVQAGKQQWGLQYGPDGTVKPAPPLDPGKKTATVGGETIPVEPVDA